VSEPTWRYTQVTHSIPAFRAGWRGAWDAIRAALTGSQRPQFPINVSFGVYVKGNAEAYVSGGTVLTTEPKP
jgi:hypothetical protein